MKRDMLPDFPEIKSRLQKIVDRNLKIEEFRLYRESFLTHIPVFTCFEGDKSSLRNKIEEMEQVIQEFELKSDEIIKKGFKAYEEKVKNAQKEFIKEKERLTLKAFSAAAEEVGNVVDASKKTSEEALLESLAKLDISFDESGNPATPLVIVNPKMRDKLARTEPGKEYFKKSNELMERKKIEWVNREDHRKLVD